MVLLYPQQPWLFVAGWCKSKISKNLLPLGLGQLPAPHGLLHFGRQIREDTSAGRPSSTVCPKVSLLFYRPRIEVMSELMAKHYESPLKCPNMSVVARVIICQLLIYNFLNHGLTSTPCRCASQKTRNSPVSTTFRIFIYNFNSVLATFTIGK